MQRSKVSFREHYDPLMYWIRLIVLLGYTISLACSAPLNPISGIMVSKPYQTGGGAPGEFNFDRHLRGSDELLDDGIPELHVPGPVYTTREQEFAAEKKIYIHGQNNKENEVGIDAPIFDVGGATHEQASSRDTNTDHKSPVSSNLNNRQGHTENRKPMSRLGENKESRGTRIKKQPQSGIKIQSAPTAKPKNDEVEEMKRQILDLLQSPDQRQTNLPMDTNDWYNQLGNLLGVRAPPKFETEYDAPPFQDDKDNQAIATFNIGPDPQNPVETPRNYNQRNGYERKHRLL